MLEERNLAEKSADLEVGELEAQLLEIRDELNRESLHEREIFTAQRDFLLDHIARLYVELYEIDD